MGGEGGRRGGWGGGKGVVWDAGETAGPGVEDRLPYLGAALPLLSTAGDGSGGGGGFGGGGSGSTMSSVSAFGCHDGDSFLPEQSYCGGAMQSEEEEAAVAGAGLAAPARYYTTTQPDIEDAGSSTGGGGGGGGGGGSSGGGGVFAPLPTPLFSHEDLAPTYHYAAATPSSGGGGGDSGGGGGRGSRGGVGGGGEQVVLGCPHYRRACKMRAPCCQRLFTCRLCHDQAMDHTVDREEVKEMLCMRCGTLQPMHRWVGVGGCIGRFGGDG